MLFGRAQEDQGIASAFNKGIARAHGQVIGIINSDDWYDEKTVAWVVEGFQRSPARTVFHGDLCLYKEGQRARVDLPGQDPDKLWEGMIYNHPTCFVTRDCYDKWGVFNEHYRVAMDYELMLRFYRQGACFIYIPQVLAHMRGSGASHQRAIEGLRECYQARTAAGYPKLKARWQVVDKGFRHFVKEFLGQEHKMLKLWRQKNRP